VIIGDSRLIIQALILCNKAQNAKLQHILEKIHLLLGKLRTHQLYHVFRGMNATTNEEANRGALSRIGTLQINGTSTSWELP
jgi:hypothetical protein